MFATIAPAADVVGGCQSNAFRCVARTPLLRSSPPSRIAVSHSWTMRRNRISGIATAKPKKISSEELEVELAERSVPIVIDFYAAWCGPCVLLAKELEQVAEELGDKVKILKIDTDENQDLSTQLQIQGLPTMVFVSTDTSKPALRTEGMLPASTILEIVAKELG